VDQGGKEEIRPSAFAGDLTLDGLRMNQLKLSRNLTGTVLLSQDRFQIRAKVRRACCSTTTGQYHEVT